MPFEYLREIARTQLPLTVDTEANIDKLRVLRAADLVSVMLPSATADAQQFARVLAITPKGRQMLAQGWSDLRSARRHAASHSWGWLRRRQRLLAPLPKWRWSVVAHCVFHSSPTAVVLL